jgi:cytochrome c oxidase subunit 4
MSSVPSIGHYAKVTAALLGLLAATIVLAYVNLGPLNSAVALLISAAKAALILLFFMHLRRASGLTRLAAALGFFWFGILLAHTLSDYLTRRG